MHRHQITPNHACTHSHTHARTHRGASSPNGGLTFVSPSILYHETATRRALICPPPPPGGVSCLGVPYLSLCPAEHAQGDCSDAVALENVPTYQAYSDYTGMCVYIFMCMHACAGCLWFAQFHQDCCLEELLLAESDWPQLGKKRDDMCMVQINLVDDGSFCFV
jgi:hypothetical protein